MVLEEPLEGSEDDGGDYDEKQALSEKIAMHVGGRPTPPITHDLNKEPGKKGGEGGTGEYLM